METTSSARGRAPITGGDATAIALRTLYRIGAETREAQFRHAHACGCCYLCQVPYHVMLEDCPCPHWLVMPTSARRPAAPVFAAYGLAAVLGFLLLYVRAASTGRRLTGGAGVHLHFERRCCSVEIAAQHGDGSATVTLRRATRGREDMAATFAARPAEARLLAALSRLASGWTAPAHGGGAPPRRAAGYRAVAAHLPPFARPRLHPGRALPRQLRQA